MSAPFEGMSHLARMIVRTISYTHDASSDEIHDSGTEFPTIRIELPDDSDDTRSLRFKRIT